MMRYDIIRRYFPALQVKDIGIHKCAVFQDCPLPMIVGLQLTMQNVNQKAVHMI